MNRATINAINRELVRLTELLGVKASLDKGEPILIGFGGLTYNPTTARSTTVFDRAYKEEYADLKYAVCQMIGKSKRRLVDLGYTGDEVQDKAA